MKRLHSSLGLTLLLSLAIGLQHQTSAENQQQLLLNETQNFTVSSTKPILVLVNFTQPENETAALRLDTTSYSNTSLLLVARQHLILHTWSLPYTFADVDKIGDESPVQSFQSVSRTLCPSHLWPKTPDQQQQQVFLRVTTDSAVPVRLSVRAQLASHFRLSLGESVQRLLEPSRPQLFFFDFDSVNLNTTNLRAVRILVESNDAACGLVSVQRDRCPVKQTPPTVLQRGFRETLLSSSVIFMRREEFSSFFVVLLAFPDNRNCLSSLEQQHFSSKNVTINIEQIPMVDSEEWALLWLSVIFAGVDCLVGLIVMGCYCKWRNNNRSCKEISCLVLFYLCACLFCVVSSLSAVFLLLWFDDGKKNKIFKLGFVAVVFGILCLIGYIVYCKRMNCSRIIELVKNIVKKCKQIFNCLKNACYLCTAPKCDRNCIIYCLQWNCGNNINNEPEQPGANEEERPLLPGHEPGHEPGPKPKMSQAMQLLAVAIFYCLPVVQLMLLQQDSMNVSGNLDECYYNFKCRAYVKTSLGSFYAFNNVVSNAGYITAGIVYVMTVLWKEKYWDHENDNEDGPSSVFIPCCYSAHYAAGLALVMEGLLSACYHVCPSNNTFQFDTTFMIMLASMLGLAIHSKRNMKSGSLAKVTFVALGVTVAVNSLGILFSSVSRKFTFGILGFLLLLGSGASALTATKEDCKSRVKFLIAFFTNFAFFVLSFAIGFSESNFVFANFVLIVVFANSGLYFLYYCFRKFYGRTIAEADIYKKDCCCKLSLLTRWRWVILVLFTISVGLFLWAGWYFIHPPTDWTQSPAQSREFNNDCYTNDFLGLSFDQHDLWHMIGSQALLCILLFVLFMDFDEEREELKPERIF